MIYRKLYRVWSHNNANYIPKFKETFPELNKVSSEEMCDRWIDLGVDFYTEKKEPVPFWVRLTMPFGLIMIIVLLLGLPIKFIIDGSWSWSLNNKNYIYNWLKALKLL